MKDSPALKFKGEGYPFGNRVPKVVRMLTTVTPDIPLFLMSPEQRSMVAKHGQEYPCWVNSYGAVSALCPEGDLGLLPDEFEVVRWHDEESSVKQKPSEGRIVHYFEKAVDGTMARLAAIIARVWNDDVVNLTVFNQDGTTTPKTSVLKALTDGYAENEPIPDSVFENRWDWPQRV